MFAEKIIFINFSSRGSRVDLVNSEDEDEEGGSSTPSADHSDKNVHSLHCIR